MFSLVPYAGYMTGVEIFHHHYGTAPLNFYFTMQPTAGQVPSGLIRWGDVAGSTTPLASQTVYEFNYTLPADIADVEKKIEITVNNPSALSGTFALRVNQRVTRFGEFGFDTIPFTAFYAAQQELTALPVFNAALQSIIVHSNRLTFAAMMDALQNCKANLQIFGWGSGDGTSSGRALGQTLANPQVVDLRTFPSLVNAYLNTSNVGNTAQQPMFSAANTALRVVTLWGNNLAYVPFIPSGVTELYMGATSGSASNTYNPLTSAFDPVNNLALVRSQFYSCYRTSGQKAPMVQTIANYHAQRFNFTAPGTKILDFTLCTSISQTSDAVAYGHVLDLRAAGFTVNIPTTA